MSCMLSVQAQERTIHGTVLDATDNEPLVGATIMPVGGGQGTAADIDGKFVLKVPANVKKARVSYVGYVTQEVDLTPDMVVYLHSGASTLDETIVVAYGTAKKSAYTGAASVVKADEIEGTLVTDVTSALNGKVAGVQMRSYNGAPGISPTVYVRGTGSLTTTSSRVAPLYVIDGVPAEDGALIDLSPSDVESMTVLKDAAAAALYGARGANGVILVTTKKGQQGKTKIVVDMNWGANSREVPNYAIISGAAANYQKMYWAIRNAQHYSNGLSDAAAHQYANNQLSAAPNSNIFGYQVFTTPAGQSLFAADGSFNPNATLGYQYGDYYLTPDNWSNETLRNGLRQEYNVAASGGADKYDYMMTFNYLDNQGIIEESSYQRLNTRFVGNFQATKWLKLGANMMYAWQKSNYPEYQNEEGYSGNAFYFVNMMAPVYPFYVRNADGSIATDAATGRKLYDYGMNGLGAPNLNRTFSTGNPTGDFVYDVSTYLSDTFDGKWSAIITPLEGLTISGNVGFYTNNQRNSWLNNNQYGQMSQYGGFVEQDANYTHSTNVQALANYKHTWGKNGFDFLLGYESYSLKWGTSWGYGYDIFNNSNNTLSNVSSQKQVGGYNQSYSTRGIFARVNYDYDGRIFGSVSYRRDASSRFAPSHRWGNFWSVSAAWDLAKEKFLQDQTVLNMLKVRASFGQQGNDNIGNYYAYQDQYNMTGIEGVWDVATLYYKGNPDLTWETSNAFNVGVEFALFDGRLNGTLEYYQRQTSNMLYNKPVNPSLGYSSFPMNVGSMRNNGIELELTGTAVKTKNVQWDLNFNLTYQQNKIISLAPELNGEWINGNYYWKEGESMYNYYFVKYAGVDPDNGLPLYWAKHTDGTEYTTTNWNVAYSGSSAEDAVANRCPTGNMLPPVYGGFGTNVSFFGFDVSIQCGYQLGGKIWDYGYQMLMHNGTKTGQAFHVDAANAWTETNTNTDVPRLDSNWSYMNSTSDRWLTSAKYLAINNIQVGYNFPAKWVKKCGLSGIRIYGAADNVALWSARKGLDPRQGYFYTYASSYSTMRVISGGVKLTF